PAGQAAAQQPATTARPVTAAAAAAAAGQATKPAAPAPQGQPGAATPTPAPATAPGNGSGQAAAPGNGSGEATVVPAPAGQPPAAPTPGIPAAKPVAGAGPPAPPAVPPAVPPKPAVPGTARPVQPLARPAAPLRVPSSQATLPPRTPAGTTRARAAGAPPDPGSDGRSASRTTLAVIGGVVAVAIVAILLVTQVFGGSSGPAKPNSVGRAPAKASGAGSGGAAKTTGHKAGVVVRGIVTVAVLNGTTVVGLARSASDKLQRAGFKGGTVTNDTTNQARSATAVFYTPGNKAAALEVAKIIGVGRDGILPIDQSTRVLAGNDAQVVVTVGSDQAH
ncbi:MAG: LytR family transcriptional regulator, partial [Solirubrobacterales bacterium]|nr:LytR family transcriptional regulator [Solirubrobacterales bacterium]